MSIDPIQILQANLCEFSREIRRLKEVCSAKDAEIAELRKEVDIGKSMLGNAMGIIAELQEERDRSKPSE